MEKEKKKKIALMKKVILKYHNYSNHYITLKYLTRKHIYKSHLLRLLQGKLIPFYKLNKYYHAINKTFTKTAIFIFCIWSISNKWDVFEHVEAYCCSLHTIYGEKVLFCRKKLRFVHDTDFFITSVSIFCKF